MLGLVPFLQLQWLQISPVLQGPHPPCPPVNPPTGAAAMNIPEETLSVCFPFRKLGWVVSRLEISPSCATSVPKPPWNSWALDSPVRDPRLIAALPPSPVLPKSIQELLYPVLSPASPTTPDKISRSPTSSRKLAVIRRLEV